MSSQRTQLSRGGGARTQTSLGKEKDWSHYSLHKGAAHRHLDEAKHAERQGNKSLALLCYNKAIDARLKADSLWTKLHGPSQANSEHALFTLSLILHRDKLKSMV